MSDNPDVALMPTLVLYSQHKRRAANWKSDGGCRAGGQRQVVPPLRHPRRDAQDGRGRHCHGEQS